MLYDDVLVKILPELKKYLSKLSWKMIGYIEDDEIFSEAIVRVCDVIEKKKDKVENPEQYIKGCFWMQVRRIQTDVVRNRYAMERVSLELGAIKENLPNESVNAESIIAELNDFGDGATHTIWESLKKHSGNVGAVSMELGCHEQNVFYHKRKLKDKYKKLKKIYSA